MNRVELYCFKCKKSMRTEVDIDGDDERIAIVDLKYKCKCGRCIERNNTTVNVLKKTIRNNKCFI